jgi:hypothetical protein
VAVLGRLPVETPHPFTRVRLPRAGIPVAALFWISAPLLGVGAAEYEVKAAFLYKFASFVSWPRASDTAPLCIGILGEDPFGPALDRVVNGRVLNGRSFVVHRFKNAKDIAGCGILFISSSESRRLEQVFAALDGSSVLTVGDVPGFCEKGGIVNLETRDGRVSLQINVEAAERAHLQLSSKLLSLAAIVRGQAGANKP